MYDGNFLVNFLLMLIMVVFIKFVVDFCIVVLIVCFVVWLCVCVFGELIDGRNFFLLVIVFIKFCFLYCLIVFFKYFFILIKCDVNLLINKVVFFLVNLSCFLSVLVLILYMIL